MMEIVQIIERVLADLPKVPKVRDLESAAIECGFELLPDRGKGSHRLYQNPDYPQAPINVSGKPGSDATYRIASHVRKQFRRVLELAEEHSRSQE